MTLPLNEFVARNDSRCGIAITFVGVSSCLPPPTWKAENEQGWQVVHCGLGGGDLDRLVLGLDHPQLAAHEQRSASAGITTTSDSVAERLNADTSIPLRRYQADTASITMHPVTSRREDHVHVAPQERRVGEQRAARC